MRMLILTFGVILLVLVVAGPLIIPRLPDRFFQVQKEPKRKQKPGPMETPQGILKFYGWCALFGLFIVLWAGAAGELGHPEFFTGAFYPLTAYFGSFQERPLITAFVTLVVLCAGAALAGRYRKDYLVKAPDGKTYRFDTAKAADAFKKKAGL